jgi:hypothetical protein
MIPFATTEAERQRAGDPRPSVEARYALRDDWAARLAEERIVSSTSGCCCLRMAIGCWRRRGVVGRVPSALGSDTGAPCKISGKVMSARWGKAVRGPPAGDRYRSLVELQAAIKRFLAETNDNPKPFVWTTDPEKIIVDSACLGIRRVTIATRPS